MKRANPNKLRLARESLRHLQAPELRGVGAGAAPDPPPGGSGPTDPSICLTKCGATIGCRTYPIVTCQPPGTLVDCPLG